MRKTEIKKAIKTITESVEKLRSSYEDLLIPLKEIDKHLDAIQGLQEVHAVDTQIDFEEARRAVLVDIIENSDEWNDIHTQFEFFTADLENWMEEVSENKAEQIRDVYVTQIEDIYDGLILDEVYCEDDLDNILFDAFSRLDDFEYL